MQIASQVLPLLAGAISIPFIYRNLSAPEFGVFTIALSFLGLFSLVDLGLGRATVRFLARAFARSDFHGASALFSYSATLLGGFSFFAFITYLCSVSYVAAHLFQSSAIDAHTLRHCLYILGGAIPLAGLTSVFRAVLEAREKFLAISAAQAFMGTATYVVPLTLSFWFHDIELLIAGAVACRIAIFFVFAVAAAKMWPGPFTWRAIDHRSQSEFRDFSTWTVISNLIGSSIVYGDRAILVKMFGLSEIAFYNIPLELLGRLMIIVNSGATVVFPALSKISENKTLFEDLYVALITILSALVGMTLLLLSLATPFGLQWWLGAEFSMRSTGLVQILLIGLGFQTINVLALASLNARGIARPITFMHLAETPLYFSCLYYFGLRHGLPGVAMVWSARLAVEFLCFVGFSLYLGEQKRAALRFKGALLALCNILPLVLEATSVHWPVVAATSGLFAGLSIAWAARVLRNGRSQAK